MHQYDASQEYAVFPYTTHSMARIIRKFHADVLRPTGQTIALGLRLNHLIWTKYFDIAWEATPMHEKLTWILFISNTLCILTIIQFLAR